MKAGLKRPYIRIEAEDGAISYGGSQKWFDNKRMSSYGCGVIAAHDVTEYLIDGQTKEREGEEKELLTEEIYKELVEDYRKRYVPLVPHLGTIGWFLAAGMNRGFKQCSLKYRAFWGVRPKSLFKSMEKMLKKDIPVILSVGPNTPNPREGYMLALYTKKPDGTYVNVNACKAHFVTATAMDENWIRVSSWGKRYYINKEEYKNYVHFHSNWLGSNIMVIRKIR